MFSVSSALLENLSDFLILWAQMCGILIGRLQQFSQILLSLKEKEKYPHFVLIRCTLSHVFHPHLELYSYVVQGFFNLFFTLEFPSVEFPFPKPIIRSAF